MKKKKILVVEDDSLNAELLSEVLKEMNYDLYWVKNGKEALNFVEDKTPSLILLDIMLPGQSGYDICRSLKNNSITKDIPVIFISALDSEKDITKPIKKDLVIARVKNQLKLNEFQKKLKTKHKQQNILLENIDTQIWYLKDKYNYGKVNSSHAEFLGVCKEDIENKRFDSFLDEELADLCEKSNEEVFAKKAKIITEEWASDHKGNKRLLRISKNPVFDDSGNIGYVVASAEDITEEKQKENRLKKTNNRLKMISKKLETIFDNIQSLVFLVDIDNGKFTYDRVNSNFENYLVMSIKDIHGRTPREIFGDEFAVILPNTDENSVLKMCSRVENEFAEIKKDNQDLNLLSISLGSFTLENNSFSFREAYRIADKRMYQNKNNKSNDL